MAVPASGPVVVPAIQLKGVIALIDGFPALAGADLCVNTGEIVRISGRNGSGKTTLLRACAGLMRLRGERAVVLGHDLLASGAGGAYARRSVRSNVGLLGHIDALYGDLTVLDQLAYTARLARADSREPAAALARVGLPARLHHVPVRRLSTGQRRRLALAVMILVRPRLWLLDEPHAGVDEPGRAMIDELLHEATAAGATVLLVTHEQQTHSAGQPASQAADQPAAPKIREVCVAGGQVSELGRAAPHESAPHESP